MRKHRETRRTIYYLVVFAGVPQEVPQKVEARTLSDQDEVGGAVGQVSGGREAFGAPGTSTAHAGSVYGEELPSDCPPLAVIFYNRYTPPAVDFQLF